MMKMRGAPGCLMLPISRKIKILFPKGPRTQIIGRVLGAKYHNVNGSWALKPYYLGPWTLRDCFQKRDGSRGSTLLHDARPVGHKRPMRSCCQYSI